eukprot:1053085-Pleurochrysis_carterae.AAC.1
MGHWPGFTAIHADGGIHGISPRSDRIYPIGSYVLRGAGCQNTGDHVSYGAPRHISEVVPEVVVSATASRACSCTLEYYDLTPNISDYVCSGVAPLSF